MTSDDLCIALVGHFNAQASKPIAYQASYSDDVDEVMKERSDYRVFVGPNSESEEPFDRGDTCREEFIPSVVVTGPINAQTTKGKAAELVRFLRDSLRETELLGLTWDGNSVESLYDPVALKTKKQFVSLFKPTYYRFA